MALPPDVAIKQFWPTTFFSRLWSEHSTESAEIINFLYQLKSREPNQIASGIAIGAKSSTGLYESNFDLFSQDHPGLNKLKIFIGQTVQAAVAHINGDREDPRRLIVAVTDSWYHITNHGGFHDSHFHGGCSWCGIYYLQIGDSGSKSKVGAPNGGNRFYSPLHTGGIYKDYGNQYLDFNFTDPPLKDGMLLLFPSYLMHNGLPYQGSKDRIIISFNCHIHLKS